jgi:hypothetical protein
MTISLSTGDGSGGRSGFGQVAEPMFYATVPTTIAGGVGDLIGSRL